MLISFQNLSRSSLSRVEMIKIKNMITPLLKTLNISVNLSIIQKILIMRFMRLKKQNKQKKIKRDSVNF